MKPMALSVLRAEARKRFVAWNRMPVDGTVATLAACMKGWQNYRRVRKQIREVVLMLARSERVASGPLPADLAADLLKDAG